MAGDVPVKAFIIFRDRVTYARQCVAALDKAGLDVWILDHGSTWPDAKDWLEKCQGEGRNVLYRGPGRHPRQLWDWVLFREECGRDRYIVTDADVVPDEDCPLDWPERLSGLMDQYLVPKVALGLRINDIPDYHQRKPHVISWESKYWRDEAEPGVYAAPSDTTLALYEALPEQTTFTMLGLRTGPPYVARHLPWYEDFSDLTPEISYYYSHSEPKISFWHPEDGYHGKASIKGQ